MPSNKIKFRKRKRCEFEAKDSSNLNQYGNLISNIKNTKTNSDKTRIPSDSIHPVVIDLTDDDPVKKKKEEIKFSKKYKCKKCQFITTDKQAIRLHSLIHQN